MEVKATGQTNNADGNQQLSAAHKRPSHHYHARKTRHPQAQGHQAQAHHRPQDIIEDIKRCRASIDEIEAEPFHPYPVVATIARSRIQEWLEFPPELLKGEHLERARKAARGIGKEPRRLRPPFDGEYAHRSDLFRDVTPNDESEALNRERLLIQALRTALDESPTHQVPSFPWANYAARSTSVHNKDNAEEVTVITQEQGTILRKRKPPGWPFQDHKPVAQALRKYVQQEYPLETACSVPTDLYCLFSNNGQMDRPNALKISDLKFQFDAIFPAIRDFEYWHEISRVKVVFSTAPVSAEDKTTLTEFITADAVQQLQAQAGSEIPAIQVSLAAGPPMSPPAAGPSVESYYCCSLLPPRYPKDPQAPVETRACEAQCTAQFIKIEEFRDWLRQHARLTSSISASFYYKPDVGPPNPVFVERKTVARMREQVAVVRSVLRFLQRKEYRGQAKVLFRPRCNLIEGIPYESVQAQAEPQLGTDSMVLEASLFTELIPSPRDLEGAVFLCTLPAPADTT